MTGRLAPRVLYSSEMASIETSEPKLSPEELSVWTAEGQGISIEYRHSALEDVRLEAVKGITLLRHGGVEVGGVLFGTRHEDRIRIFDSRPLRSEYAYGPNLLLSQNDEEALKRLLEEASADPKLSGMEPVGWYHSHTRTGVFLSESDIAIYNRHFPEPWQVALIVHPAQLGPTEAGFFFREADGSLRSDSSYHTFTIYPTYPPAKALEVDRETEGLNPALDARAEALLDSSRSKDLLLPPPHRYAAEKPSRLSWPWLLAALVLGVLGVGILTGIFHISGWPVGHPTLNLRATDRGGQVHVEWDRGADPVQAAQKASLLIQDGDRKLETPLSGELLQHGSLTYRRKTGDVEIRLRVYGDDAEPVQESTRLIGLPVVPEERIEAADRPVRSPRGAKRLAVTESSPGEPTIEWVDKGKRESPAVAEKPELVSRNIVSAPRAEESAYRGPTRGRLIWSGRVPANGHLEITGTHASTGNVTGKLPDVPIKISAYPASFSRHGITAYASDLPNGKEFHEPPGRTNGWTEITYKRNAKRSAAITVTQIPAARNHWRSIGLKADRGVSVLVIDWEVLRGSGK